MKDAIDYLCARDEKLKAIIETHGHPVIQKRAEGFAAMCHIILEQQVSIASAQACYRKLVESFGALLPGIILSASDEALRGCGVSRQKALYMKDLAQKVLSGAIDFSSFTSKTEQQIRAELLAIKGVGNWSAEVYLMFCLQSPDIIPLGDIAIKNTIIELFGPQSLDGMELLSQNWKPHRTMASYILWHHYLEKKKKPKK